MNSYNIRLVLDVGNIRVDWLLCVCVCASVKNVYMYIDKLIKTKFVFYNEWCWKRMAHKKIKKIVMWFHKTRYNLFLFCPFFIYIRSSRVYGPDSFFLLSTLYFPPSKRQNKIKVTHNQDTMSNTFFIFSFYFWLMVCLLFTTYFFFPLYDKILIFSVNFLHFLKGRL